MDVLGAARRVARAVPRGGRRAATIVGPDTLLERASGSYLEWLRGRLDLGAGNESDGALVTVELDQLPANTTGELQKWMNTTDDERTSIGDSGSRGRR